MRKFNEVSGLWRGPLFSKALYRDVGGEWRGIGLRYLMLVTAVVWMVVLVKATVGMNRFVTMEAPGLFADFPPITVKGGKASSPVAQPYVMRDKGGRAIFVLDTTGATHAPAEVGARILVTRTEFIQEQSPGHVETRPLSSFPDMTVDAGSLLSWTKTVRNLLIPVAFPLMWGMVLMYRLVVALAIAGIGAVVAMGFGARLSFAALLRLAMVAMTADMWLGLALWFMPVGLGCGGWFFGHALSLGYMVYGVKVNADEQREGRMAFPVEPGAGGGTGVVVGDGDTMFP